MRKTALRLVSSTASQSSSFKRIASMSRVIPALLTSTCNPPWSLTIRSTSACAAMTSFTSRFAPAQPGKAARVWVILAAPSSLVAVPITTRPLWASSSAIAAPMPRDAPVTKATWPSNFDSLMPAAPLQTSLMWGQTGVRLSTLRQSFSPDRPALCPAHTPQYGLRPAL